MHVQNVTEDGSICLGILKADQWKPSTKCVTPRFVHSHSLTDATPSQNGDESVYTLNRMKSSKLMHFVQSSGVSINSSSNQIQMIHSFPR